MLLKDTNIYLRAINCLCKFIIFLAFLLLLPSFFKLFDHGLQKCFGFNRYINAFDFIFFNFLAVCFIKKDKIKEKMSTPVILFILYIFLARISLFLCDGEIHFKAFYDLFKSFLVFLLFVSFFTDFFQKNYKIIIKSFLVIFFTIALFESIVGIMQFILQKPLGFHFLKEPFFSIENDESAKIFISQSKQFFFNKFSTNEQGYFLRAHGTFFHPNIFSGFLNISSILTFFLIYKSKKKIFFSIFLSFQLIALIFTFSRAGISAFVLSSFLFFFLMFIKKYEIKKMFLIFLIFFLTIGVGFSRYLIERGFLGKIFQSDKAIEMNIGSSDIRHSLKEISIKIIKNKPFFGVGFRNFLIKKDEYSNEKIDRAYVHNIYLVIASETGLISLLVFLALLFIIFINSIRYCLNPLNISIFCSIVSFLVIGFFDHYPISTYLGKMLLFTFLGFLNYENYVNKLSSYSQKAFLYQ